MIKIYSLTQVKKQAQPKEATELVEDKNLAVQLTLIAEEMKAKDEKINALQENLLLVQTKNEKDDQQNITRGKDNEAISLKIKLLTEQGEEKSTKIADLAKINVELTEDFKGLKLEVRFSF